MIARVVVLAALLGALLTACSGDPEPHHPGAFVIGFDGMEPTIVEDLMDRDLMPNFSRLAEQGGYRRLGTSLPPESPVAWANFNTGLDPGGHGVFDFIHRDLEKNGISLYFATTKSSKPETPISLFGYRFWLSGGETRLLVKGKYFWEYLTEREIPVSIVRVPSNYPPKDVGARAFPGMGTPDVLGSYGVFSLYAEDPPLNASEMRDAHVFSKPVIDGKVEYELRGPRNIYLPAEKRGDRELPAPYSTVPLTIYVDRERKAARIDVDEEIRILAEGEWSDWVPVSFTLVPNLVSSSGMVRLYLKSVSPLTLYVSPVNVDPLDPDIPLSTPPEACEELAKSIGRYYTQGMAEDTQAVRYGVLTIEEFLKQSEIVLEERRKMLRHELERFRRLGGMTFFYFSTTDLTAHMLFHNLDESHPRYDAAEAEKYRGKLDEIYIEMDRLLGEVMESVPEGTRVVVMSDHGFKSYRRQLNLNSWLYEKGFLVLKNPERRGEIGNFANVDLKRSRAYSVGFSGICLNLVGRESPGFLHPGEEAEEVKAEIIRLLLAERDPKDGAPPVAQVYRREDVYHGDEVEHAPDLIVGFSLYYGCSDDSATGRVSREVYKDTDDAWGGSHLMDPSVVPGILLVNRPITIPDPDLKDLPVSILGDFGVTPEGMRGRRVWKGED